MPHHYRRRTKYSYEVLIYQTTPNPGEPIPESTVVLTVPKEDVFSDGKETTRDDVEALAGALQRTLEELDGRRGAE